MSTHCFLDKYKCILFVNFIIFFEKNVELYNSYSHNRSKLVDKLTNYFAKIMNYFIPTSFFLLFFYPFYFFFILM